MQFKRISLRDKSVFDKFLSLRQHRLSAYTFENIFIWKRLYDIFWVKIDKNLCVFFKDKIGCFSYLPPLGKRARPFVLSKCFEVMDRYNKNTDISRVENVEESDLGFYKKLEYKIVLGGCDYICKRKSLIELKGGCFKKKRTAINSFIRNNKFRYQAYISKNKKECIILYQLWMRERKKKNQDSIYQRLLEDNFIAFKTALDYFDKSGFVGRVIKIDNKIEAVTFGYHLSSRDFVIIFEICNLKFKGIAQYIFREFCGEQSSQNINIMDDSGIDSLKRTKLSYNPFKKEGNFIIGYG